MCYEGLSLCLKIDHRHDVDYGGPASSGFPFQDHLLIYAIGKPCASYHYGRDLADF